MRILICTPFAFNAARGNSVASRRLTQGFHDRGHEVITISNNCLDHGDCAVRVAREFDPAVFLVMHARRCADALLRICAARPELPTVVSLRGTDINEMLHDPIEAPYIESALDCGHRIVVFSPELQLKLCRWRADTGPKTRIIPNGVELFESDVDYRARFRIPDSALVFLSIGGLRRIKNPLAPVGLLAELRQGEMDLRFIHAGPPLEADLTAELEGLARERRWVSAVGVVPHAEIDSLLRAGDIFVSASRSEGMPHAVMEAMLAGKPLLLSDIPGHRNLARAGEEALFFGDEKELKAGAERLAADPELRRRLGRNAQRRMTDFAAAHDEVGSYIQLFTELIDSGPGGPSAQRPS